MVDILIKNYENIYFWPQGFHDDAYFRQFTHKEKIHRLNPNLTAFSNFLKETDVDYVDESHPILSKYTPGKNDWSHLTD